ncbi:hypothetical protein E3N88_14773 [Mikania micrantha]|uniref:Integrase catalytic domain-containing protein n=1 Tax=Mikania micrantha TaxID=192012 RepID=A0A5N6P4C4_9ASTR|nr:hypothetical protein E3N88_14773 [Mikania micrantha]
MSSKRARFGAHQKRRGRSEGQDSTKSYARSAMANNNQRNAFPPITLQWPVLTATNYTIWVVKLKAIFNAHGLWEAIEPGIGANPANPADAKKNSAAIAYLFQAMPEYQILQVANLNTAREIWESLKTRYVGVDRFKKARLATLKNEFESIRMKENESIDEFAGRLSAISSKSMDLGEQIEEKTLVRKLLNSLPERFILIVASIEQFVDLDTILFQEAIGRVKAFEERANMKKKQSSVKEDDQLLLTYSQWQQRNKGYDSKGKNDCPAPGINNQEANMAQVNDDEESVGPALFMMNSEVKKEVVFLNERRVIPTSYETEPVDEQVWYLDNGASNHMSGNVSIFSSIDRSVGGTVKFGDGSTVVIEGRGSIILEGKQDEQKLLTDVYYIPHLRNNIFSLGQATEAGCEVKMKDEFLWLSDHDGRLLMKVKRSPNRLYKLSIKSVIPKCFMTEMSKTPWLWHGRLGHVNFDSLRLMSSKNMVKGVPLISHPQQVCDACLAGSKYFMLIVDDFTKYMWCHLLKSKDQALEAFKVFKGKVENKYDLKLKTLRSDRGGEFTSHDFNDYCAKEGVERQVTAPYSPQQNGSVERRNRSILNMTRSMMNAMKLPQDLWAESVRHSVYLLNRLYTKPLVNKTPYEVLKGRKPNLQDVKVFGCVGYVKVTKPGLKKLEDRSISMVHLGMEPGTKGYRMYDVENNKIVVSRDVRFDETRGWDWSNYIRRLSDNSQSWIEFSVQSEDAEEIEGMTIGQNEQPMVQPQQEQVLRRSTWSHSLPIRLNDYVLEGSGQHNLNLLDEVLFVELLLAQDEEPTSLIQAASALIKSGPSWFLASLEFRLNQKFEAGFASSGRFFFCKKPRHLSCLCLDYAVFLARV